MAEVLKYDIRHTTAYRYEAEMNACMFSLCMQPRNHLNQVVREFFIFTDPHTNFSVDFDAFGNAHHYFDIHQPHQSLQITVSASIERPSATKQNESHTLPYKAWRELDHWKNDWDMWDFLNQAESENLQFALSDWEASQQFEDVDPLAWLINLSQRIHDQFDYLPGSTQVDTTVEEFLRTKTGVCQDYASFMLCVARRRGIPARYVSGYLYDVDAETEIAANATHAWVECCLPRLGWLQFDPTNPAVDLSNLITVAIGRDYTDVAPTRGVTFGEGDTELDVNVTVTRELAQPLRVPRIQQAQQQQ